MEESLVTRARRFCFRDTSSVQEAVNQSMAGPQYNILLGMAGTGFGRTLAQPNTFLKLDLCILREAAAWLSTVDKSKLGKKFETLNGYSM